MTLILFVVAAAVMAVIVQRQHDGRWRRHRDHFVTFLQLLFVGYLALVYFAPFVSRDVSAPVLRLIDTLTRETDGAGDSVAPSVEDE
jgi:hypothetical protein